MTKNEWISIAKILVFIRIQLQFVREVDISKTQKKPVMFRFTGVYILVPLGGASSNRWLDLLKNCYMLKILNQFVLDNLVNPVM
jgi:hypothetical protein